MKNKCKDCIYYQRINTNEESWGTCNWFEHNTVDPMPVWVNKKDMSKYGSISPEQSKCDVFDAGEE